VAHYEPIETEAKRVVEKAVANAGLSKMTTGE